MRQDDVDDLSVVAVRLDSECDPGDSPTLLHRVDQPVLGPLDDSRFLTPRDEHDRALDAPACFVGFGGGPDLFHPAALDNGVALSSYQVTSSQRIVQTLRVTKQGAAVGIEC